MSLRRQGCDGKGPRAGNEIKISAFTASRPQIFFLFSPRPRLCDRGPTPGRPCEEFHMGPPRSVCSDAVGPDTHDPRNRRQTSRRMKRNSDMDKNSYSYSLEKNPACYSFPLFVSTTDLKCDSSCLPSHAHMSPLAAP